MARATLGFSGATCARACGNSDVAAWLGLEAVALARLCMALALKNPGKGQGRRKPQATAWLWPGPRKMSKNSHDK
jgi:hypothetical protein